MRTKIHYIIPTIICLCSVSIVYLGWIRGIEIFKTFYPGHIAMRPSSAVMLFIIGIMMMGFAEFKKRSSKFICLFSAVALSIAVYTLLFVRYPNIAWEIEKLFGYGYFVKTALDPKQAPSVATMVNSGIMAFAGLCSIIDNKSKLIRVLGAFVGFSGLLGIIGHITQIRPLYSYSHITQGMAFNTCILYMLSGFNFWLLHRRYNQAEI